jgi:hypothetical protein
VNSGRHVVNGHGAHDKSDPNLAPLADTGMSFRVLAPIVRYVIATSSAELAAAKQAMANGDHAAAATIYAAAVPVDRGPADDLATALRTGDGVGATKAMDDLVALLGALMALDE